MPDRPPTGATTRRLPTDTAVGRMPDPPAWEAPPEETRRRSGPGMSSYNSATITFTTIAVPTGAELVRAAIAWRRNAGAAPWVSSQQLLELAGAAPGPPRGRSSALGRRAALDEMPMALALLTVAEPAALTRVDALLQQGALRRARGDLASAHGADGAADRALRHALEATARRLGVDERRLAVGAAERALRRMGFDAERADGTWSTGVWATRHDQAMAVLIRDGGTLETDVVGCGGGSCAPVVGELRRHLAVEGAEVELRRTESHGDVQGGLLISRARHAARGRDLARGLVQQHEVGLPAQAGAA